MWTRAELKAKAKENLKVYYWQVFLALFIANLFKIGTNLNFSVEADALEYMTAEEIVMVLGVMFVFFIISFAISTFVTNIIIVGLRRFLLYARLGEVSLSHLFDGFRNGNYVNVMKTMLIMNVKIFLWSLLFIVPGIIKAYEYYMVPYILAEDPQIDTKEVFRRTKVMMEGEKWNTFVLEISFIGWQLLGVCACCIGAIFVQPYIEVTMAELYDRLRTKTIPPQPVEPINFYFE